MSSAEVVIDALEACVGSAQAFAHALDEEPLELQAEASSRLQWLLQQISTRITQMEGLRLDLESGLSAAHLGYSSIDEMLETVADIAVEIANFQRLVRELKGLAR